jgi:SAM-dependent methyltransferase
MLSESAIHYNEQKSTNEDGQDFSSLLQERDNQPLAPLKKLHNLIKRELLLQFTTPDGTLLDIGCGAGGDLQKWHRAKLRKIFAFDSSESQVQRLLLRYENMCIDFPSFPQVSAAYLPDWGTKQMVLGCFDTISCMNALHFFLASPQELATFFLNVRNNLKPGGMFIGMVPDGEKVLGWRNEEGQLLHIDRRWKEGEELHPCGAAYGFSLQGTVTESERPPNEYLVRESVLCQIASRVSLKPIITYHAPRLGNYLNRGDKNRLFKHIWSTYHGKQDLQRISDVFAVFVFCKV